MRRVLTVVLFVVLASIDNTVLALLPELAPRIRHDFGVSNHRLGLLMGLLLAVVALTRLAWGYRSDQADRRRLLIIGTLTWAVPLAAVPFSRAYLPVCALLLLAAVGLGGRATVGYSLITDLVPARWRGSLLGLWSGAQALGALGGGLLAGLLAPGADWRHRLRAGGAGAGDKHVRPALVHSGRCTATGVSRAADRGLSAHLLRALSETCRLDQPRRSRWGCSAADRPAARPHR